MAGRNTNNIRAKARIYNIAYNPSLKAGVIEKLRNISWTLVQLN